jgi:hypothetical protein
MMEAVSTSETSANLYQTALRNIPEHSNTHLRENLKSHQLSRHFNFHLDRTILTTIVILFRYTATYSSVTQHIILPPVS